jgi:M6 family metalloprotease-like protein
MLLIASTTVAQETQRRGRGCWRTPTAQKHAASRLAGKRGAESTTTYRGKKKGLVILCEFKDKTFNTTHDKQKYNDILNTRGYTSSEGFQGSVADYFLAQSDGLFELDFDVVGPYTTLYETKYYGKNTTDGYDMRPEEMVIEMCKAADEEVNFADYDWDDDGEVDEVFVVYAGKGEADGGGATTIWPHMWTLDEAWKKLTLDGRKINVYACANELDSYNSINGIGTFCHEFSHCLGFADFYDLSYSGLYGMGSFDVMDAGLYGKNGFCPVGYSAFEKWSCGWQQPIVLSSEDVTVDSLKPLNKQGDFYVIYNDAYPDEYYVIENRQKTGWDAALPSKGLMISHVDYDEEVWYNNIPNTILTEKEAKEQGYTCGNDHQRMTFFHANNSKLSPALYPSLRRDSLTATSTPAATLYHANSFGAKVMMGSILNIKQNNDGTMSFKYRATNPTIVTAISDPLDHNALHGKRASTIYTLDGRVAGSSLERLRPGIYIVDRQKVVIK